MVTLDPQVWHLEQCLRPGLLVDLLGDERFGITQSRSPEHGDLVFLVPP